MTDLGDVTFTVNDVTFTVNDVARTLPGGATCRDLISMETGATIGTDGRTGTGQGLGVALARDGEIVPRGAWAHTGICDGDRFDLVTAVQGG